MVPRTIFQALATILLSGNVVSAACTRASLIAGAQSYIDAQTAGKPSALGLASTSKYMQNNKARDIASGLLSTPFKLELVRTSADTTACATYTMWISTSPKPYVVGTQITYSPSNSSASGLAITLIDTVAATTGDLFFDATKTKTYIQKEDWSYINATASRPSRELLKTVGDSYLDMWTDAKAADRIPWGTECERVEGSQYTNPCGKSLPRGGSAKANGMRRCVLVTRSGWK